MADKKNLTLSATMRWRALLKRKERKVRQCLGCDKPFVSKGPENRRCSKCSADLAYVFMRQPHRLLVSVDSFPRMREGMEDIPTGDVASDIDSDREEKP